MDFLQAMGINPNEYEHRGVIINHHRARITIKDTPTCWTDFTISTEIGGRHFEKSYLDYTRREAVKEFKKFVESLLNQ